MKQRLLFLLKVYAWFMLVFILQKPIFMLYYFDLYRGVDFLSWLQVILHGLPLDLSLSAYILVLPVLIVALSIWIQGHWARLAFTIYFTIVGVLLSVVFLSDLGLYSYWGFRLDTTPLFYLKSPAEALASVPTLALFVMPLCFVLYTFLIVYPLKKWVVNGTENWYFCKKRLGNTLGTILLLAFLFIPIRGGFSVSTMNIGRVYFSTEMSLNHAAINPLFSLMSSWSKEQDFKEQYRFLDDGKATALFLELKGGKSYIPSDSLRWIKGKPNVLMIILESFSGTAMDKLGGVAGVMPNLSKLADEGLFFSNFYANSFRTDRGLVSILSGYPAQPTTSIMKYPAKSQTLPSISGELKKKGYHTQFIYGGDADFTNMRSYFISSGIDDIISDQNFPIQQRLSKWGANDQTTFKWLTETLKQQDKDDLPFFKIFLTLSSHEPFDVPYKKFENKYLNSVAYTDSCLGVFIAELKKTPLWDNTLIVLLPDHAMQYPEQIEYYSPDRHHIPMVWTGGAVISHKQIDEYASQIDLAATLLGQLGIEQDAFVFSKNIADSTLPKFAFYTFKDGFGFLDAQNKLVYDCESNRIINHSGNSNMLTLKKGEAFLQKLYDDLSNR